MSESADAEDSTNPTTKSWASDSAGIKPIGELRDANLSDRTIGAKLWISARRQIIFKLQVTNNLWDCLVEFASLSGKGAYFKAQDRVTLIEYEGLGGLCDAGRDTSLRQPDVRLRSQCIIEAFLPDCMWLDDFKSLDKASPILK